MTRRNKKTQQQQQQTPTMTTDLLAALPAAPAPAFTAEMPAEAATAATQPSRRSLKKQQKQKQKQQQKQQHKQNAAAIQQQQQSPHKPAASAAKPPTKPAAVVFPEFPADAPVMGFAAPHTQLSSDVRAFIDDAIDAARKDPARSHLVAHMQRGLEQIEAFMAQQHTDAHGECIGDFDTVVQRDTALWADHVATARADSDMRVQDRALQSSLRVALAGMDLKVGRPGRPDDAVYAKSAYARECMPRGNFVAAWQSRTTGATLHFPLVRAYRKFTGQEDDGEARDAVDAAELSKFFTQPKTQARSVVSTAKENGEAAHLAVLKRADGAFLFAVGSKNTHFVTLGLDDVDAAIAAGCAGTANNNNDPYKAAAPLARAVLLMLTQLAPVHRLWLCEFLWQTRLTASFEVLCPSHQHVQRLDYLDGIDTPVFYGVSLPALVNHSSGAEICVNPVLPLELLRALGVRTVAFDVVPFVPEAYDAALRTITTRYMHEGAVNLFVDAAANVIGLEKVKTVWYVSLRAIREKAKAFVNKLAPSSRRHHHLHRGALAAMTPDTRAAVVAESQLQISKRFVAIQRFVHVSSDVARAYAVLGHRFIEYLSAERLGDGVTIDDVARVKRDVTDLFPVVWQQFLAHTGLSDVIDAA